MVDRFLECRERYSIKSTHFFQLDPVSQKGTTTEEHAILTTDLVHVPETSAISDTYERSVVGPTQGVTD